MSDSDFKMSGSESEKEGSTGDKEGTRKPRTNLSKCWDFFDKIEDRPGYAKCRLCQIHLSYKASVSNLSKHALRKHRSIWQNHLSLRCSQDIPELIHFTQSNDLSVASCRLCNESIPSDRSSLRKHLARNHPEVNCRPPDGKPRIIISENGQFYEIETTEDPPDSQEIDALETSAVYLDEYKNEIKAENLKPKSNKRKRKFTYIPNGQVAQVQGGAENSSNLEQTQVQKPSSELSGLDLFCTYLISLLKELPDRECKRLQAEFVNAAVEAHLKSAQSLTASDTMNSTTVAE